MLNEDITLTLDQALTLSGGKHAKSCWCHFTVISTNTQSNEGQRKVKQAWSPESRKPPACSLLSSRSVIQLSLSLSAYLFITEALEISEQ